MGGAGEPCAMPKVLQAEGIALSEYIWCRWEGRWVGLENLVPKGDSSQ